MPLEIVTVPCLRDNYAYLLRDEATGEVGLVDAPEAGPIEAELAARGWRLGLILITHHHNDHVAGVDRLRAAAGAKDGVKVVGPAAERARLPALDTELKDGDRVALGASAAEVIEVPGHTLGHIAFHFPDAAALFSADSLMVMGCGRVFEGSMEAMWGSLSRLAALPDPTLVHSGHEYAESNLRFALSLGSDDALDARAAEIAAARAEGRPTVPAQLDLERATNPFLRASDPAFKARLGLGDRSDAAVFAELRRRKDAF